MRKRSSASTQQEDRPVFRAVAALVFVQLFLALTMAASPDLHRLLHLDADHGDHECVVTSLLSGDWGDGAPPIMVAPAPLETPHDVIFVGRPWIKVAPLFLMNGVLEHAPPALA